MSHLSTAILLKGTFKFSKKNFSFLLFFCFICFYLGAYLLLLQISRLREGAIDLARLLIEAADPVILL